MSIPIGVLINKAEPFLSVKVGRNTSCQTSGLINAASSITKKSKPSPRSLWGLSADLQDIEPPFGNITSMLANETLGCISGGKE